MGFGFIFILIFWGVVIAVAIWLGKSLMNENGSLSGIFGSQGKNSAMEILERRYASGEITRDEFEIMKTDIK
jgi:putative membrane protein